jgi:hypothetical protein
VSHNMHVIVHASLIDSKNLTTLQTVQLDKLKKYAKKKGIDAVALCHISMLIIIQCRAFNIFQVYQYLTNYRWYFLLRFEQFS